MGGFAEETMKASEGSGGSRQGPRRPGPIGGDMAAIVFGLARRARLPALMQRHSSTLILGFFALVNGVVAIGTMALAALATGEPFVFPSLGPTAFLLFYTPMQPAASPRNTVAGHLIGAAAGYLSLVLFGLTDAEPALVTGSRRPAWGPPPCRSG
jgi:CBS domain-containing membrane protein